MIKIVAEICLYGNNRPECGAGYLVSIANPGNGPAMLGDGEPLPGRTMTDAVFLACLDLKDSGITGQARVFAATGDRMATIDIMNPPWFGRLEWEPATVIEISYDAIMAASEKI